MATSWPWSCLWCIISHVEIPAWNRIFFACSIWLFWLFISTLCWNWWWITWFEHQNKLRLCPRESLRRPPLRGTTRPFRPLAKPAKQACFCEAKVSAAWPYLLHPSKQIFDLRSVSRTQINIISTKIGLKEHHLATLSANNWLSANYEQCS